VSFVRFVSMMSIAAMELSAAAAHGAPPSDVQREATGDDGARSEARAGFEILALAGVGESTAGVRNVELEPYGASVGLDAGYAFRSGFRVGASSSYGFGRTVRQRHEARTGDDFDFDAEASSLNLAMTLSYDVPLGAFALRYGLGFGGTFMRWDLGGIPPESVFSEVPSRSPTSGFHLAPGVALLLPYDIVEYGLGFDYLVQANGAIPPAFFAKVLVGVRL
jgi:hypothetical protein